MIRKYVKTWANSMSPPFIGIEVKGVLVSDRRYRFDNAPELRELLAMSKDRFDYRFDQEKGMVWFASTKGCFGYAKIGDFLFMKGDGHATSRTREQVFDCLAKRIYVVLGDLNDLND